MSCENLLPECKVLCCTLSVFLYSGCFRIGELIRSVTDKHVLLTDNVKWSLVNKHVTGVKVTLCSFKFSNGKIVTILIPINSDRIICPVNWLEKWLSLKIQKTKFLFAFSNGVLPSSDWFLTQLRLALNHYNFPAANYGTHSFRAGYITDIVDQGKSPLVIKKRGRWSSTAYLGYIRDNIIHM